jgi:hypothetical protein
MTAQELIELLQTIPSDTVVMVNGYEGGLTSFVPTMTQDVVLNMLERMK